VHHCAPVKKWLEEHTQVIEVSCLTSYSPELNPDERLNDDLKQPIETRVPCRIKGKLRLAATNHMAAIEKNPERIKIPSMPQSLQRMGEHEPPRGYFTMSCRLVECDSAPALTVTVKFSV